jgi:acyl dehydratase
MEEKKRADQVEIGEEFEPYEFCVTPEFNEQYLEAVEDHHPRYTGETREKPPIVHPGLLINHSNVTRSPSFYLPSGMAAVHAKEEVEFLNPARVGKMLRVQWKVVDTFEKRGRPYQVKEVSIVDEDGLEVLRRRITDTYLTGKR